MSALKLKSGVCIAGLCCVLAGFAQAQQRQQALDQRQIGQPGQQTTQAGQTGQQQHTAQFRGTQSTGARLNEKAEHYVANCLLIKNQAEIEISQFAQQQAENPQVKQFAQKLVQDHSQAVQKLQALPGVQANPVGQSGVRQQATDRSRNSATGDQSDVVDQLIQMDRQITQQANEMLREELQSKSGQEFDKCFLSAQIGHHMHMLAALEVIEDKAQGELGQFVQQAKPTVQQHLEQAKQLLQATESGGQTGARAQRQTERTQR